MEDIASSLNISLGELLYEMGQIVGSGTKLDINYYIDENIDESVVEDIFDYFSDAESDSVDNAIEELEEDDIRPEEIHMVRIKFLSEVAL